jgi:hypothetical protein
MQLPEQKLFKWIKKQLMAESDEYCNGKVYEDKQPPKEENQV